MVSRLNRREFLVATAGLAVAAACGGDDDKADDATGDSPGRIDVAVASAQLLAGTDQRVAVAVFQAQKPVSTGSATLRFGRSATALGDPVPAVLRKDGIEDRPFFSATTRFDQPGVWIVQASWDGHQGTSPLQVIDPNATQVPVPGKPMISTPTPTPEDHKGVEPICTADPVCALHDTSLDSALTEARPLAVLFGTPAFCRSRVCGPVLDVLLSLRDEFANVHMLHVETEPKATEFSPALRAYHLEFEPILFFVNPDGTVKSRLDGPFDRAECRQGLEQLVS